jgi:hypothetical protein
VDVVKKDGMGGTCRTDGKQEKCMQVLGRGNLKKINHSQDVRLDGRIILKWKLTEQKRREGLL